jgi:hypothetical protein
MSDRKNRDIGNKREHQKNKPQCDCWLCREGKTKKRVIRDKDIRKELGYARIGLNNI